MNEDSSTNVFINEPFEINMLRSVKPKMEEARVVLGHTFLCHIAGCIF
jgi:hypothetical protein